MSLTNPYNETCAWCRREFFAPDSYTVIRKFIVEKYDPRNVNASPEVDKSEEMLFFCSHSHRNQFLYGV